MTIHNCIIREEGFYFVNTLIGSSKYFTYRINVLFDLAGESHDCQKNSKSSSPGRVNELCKSRGKKRLPAIWWTHSGSVAQESRNESQEIPG